MDNPTAIGSMYGIFSYIWLFFMMKYGKCGNIPVPWILWDSIDVFLFQTLTPRRTFKKVDRESLPLSSTGCFKNPTVGPQQP